MKVISRVYSMFVLSRVKLLLRALVNTVTAMAVLTGLSSTAFANSPGSPVYQVASSNEVTAYSRIIRLQYSNDQSVNGQMLATFEHWYTNGSNVPLIVRKSVDGGVTWTTLATVYDPNGNTQMFQPFLFEFPSAMGGYPAGTLLLVANSIEHENTENFMTWRSTDHGATWTYVNTFETGYSGNSPSTGVWEPFLFVDKWGELVCLFSDERQSPNRSQFVGEVISEDGGATWTDEFDVMVGPNSSDRPGMATATKMGDGSYIMSAEVCGPTYLCRAHTQTSYDGSNWPDGVGQLVVTGDGRTPDGSPYIAWTPSGGANGTLLLSSAQIHLTSNDSVAPEQKQALFVNTNGGSGNWSWIGAPYSPLAANPNVAQVNYSPALLPSTDGNSVIETSTTGGGAYNDQVTLGSANAGILPYSAPFANGTDAGWIDYGGTWSVSGGDYVDSSGNGPNKAVAGSTGWSNYTLSGDVMLSSSGQAGFLVRVSNPSIGVDTLNGYFIGVSTVGDTVFIGRENGGWTALAAQVPPDGIVTNTWYHVTVQVDGSTLTVTEQPTSGGAPTTLTVTDSSFSSGAIGIRDFNTLASWRNITVN